MSHGVIETLIHWEGLMIVSASIFPHSPHLVPGLESERGLAKVKETVMAIEKRCQEIEASNLDTLIVISPHVSVEHPYQFLVNTGKYLQGNFERFGSFRMFKFQNDLAFIDHIETGCASNELPVLYEELPLDYGALVPLAFMAHHYHNSVVHVASSSLSLEYHYRFGETLGSACALNFRGNSMEKKRIGIIASGDLSHRIGEVSANELSNPGKEFDQRVLWALSQKDINLLTSMRKEFMLEADECGLRPILVMLGMLHATEYSFETVSYEAPRGVGYLVGRLVG